MYDAELEQIVRHRQSIDSKELYELKVIQDPEECRALAKQEKSRGAKWPLDPPPVIELLIHDRDPNRIYLHSPFFICVVVLETVHTTATEKQPKGLAGQTCSSLHKVKLTDNREERGFFIFGDLNVRNPGLHKLRFYLYEMRFTSADYVSERLATCVSRQFKVAPAKMHLAPRESTPLSKQLCEAGVKLRIRKETSNKRRGPQFEWAVDRSQLLPPNMFPSRNLIPSAAMSAHRHSNGAPGVDISNRLTLSTGTSLGIRSHMDNSMNSQRPVSAARNFDPWSTSQPSYSTQAPSYHHANPAYSMPPTTTSSYELQSGYSSYAETAYQTPRHVVAPSPYTTNPSVHSQPDQNHMRGPDHSYYPGSNPYGQMHTEGVMSGFDHHDTSHAHNPMSSFNTTTSMASGGSGEFTFPEFQDTSKPPFQMHPHSDGHDPFR